MDTRTFNSELKRLATPGSEITVLNPNARHNLGVGIFEGCNIRFEGSVGYYAASLLDGPEVVIDGNAGWAVGDNMMNGKITVTRGCRGLRRLDHAGRRALHRGRRRGKGGHIHEGQAPWSSGAMPASLPGL